MYHTISSDKRVLLLPRWSAMKVSACSYTNKAPEPGRACSTSCAPGCWPYLLRRGTSARRLGGLYGMGRADPWCCAASTNWTTTVSRPHHRRRHRRGRRCAHSLNWPMICGSRCTAGWHSPSSSAASGARPDAGLRVRRRHLARTPCRTPSAGQRRASLPRCRSPGTRTPADERIHANRRLVGTHPALWTNGHT